MTMKLAKREQPSFEERKMVVGLEEFEIIAVNPNAAQLSQIYETEEKDEVVYVDEKEGLDRVRICVYVRGIESKKIGKINFFIVDNERKSKDATKTQYINQTCETTWVDREDNLPDWFKHFYSKDNKTEPIGDKSYRVAMEGEADFYEFVRAVMTGVNYFSPDTEVRFNYKKFLRGDFSEVNAYLTDSDWTRSFTAMWYVRNVETEQGMKTYNEVFSKAILPGAYNIKLASASAAYYKARLEEIKSDEDLFESLHIKGMRESLTPQDIYGYVPSAQIVFKNSYEAKQVERFAKAIDGEYGCKGFYKIAPLFEYDPSMDITSGDVKSLASNDASY